MEFDAAPFGVIGLETSLSLVLTELVGRGVLSLPQAMAKMSLNPAHILGLGGGIIARGEVADLTVIDPSLRWVVDRRRFLSKSKNSPFDGWELTGRAVATIVAGHIVHRRPEDED